MAAASHRLRSYDKGCHGHPAEFLSIVYHLTKGVTVLKTMATLFVLGVVSISLAVGYQADAPNKAAADKKASEPTPAATPAAAAEPATPCCGESKEADPDKVKAGPPCSCPLYPLYPVGGGNYLYYASRYPASCSDSPTVAYVYGQYSYPLTCLSNLCAPSHLADRGCVRNFGGAFPGFSQPFRYDFEHSMPADGVARLYSYPVVDPRIPFISFTDLDSRPRWAKVFTYWINPQGAYSKLPAHCAGTITNGELRGRLIYFAFEIDGPDDIAESDIRDLREAKPLDVESQPTDSRSYVYRGIYSPSVGEDVTIMIFCAR